MLDGISDSLFSMYSLGITLVVHLWYYMLSANRVFTSLDILADFVK